MFSCEHVLESVLHRFMWCMVRFWTDEFQRFYDPVAGLDIDGAWIDMNEPTNVSRCFMRKLLCVYMQFCRLPWDDPFRQAKERNVPPPRSTLPPYPSAPIFTDSSGSLRKRFSMVKRALRWAEKKMSLTSSQPSSLSSNPFLAAVKVPMPPSNTTRPEAVTVLTNSSRGTDLLNPPYAINNAAGALSNRTLSVSSLHDFVFIVLLIFSVVSRPILFMRMV